MNKQLLAYFSVPMLLLMATCGSREFSADVPINVDNLYALHAPFDQLRTPSTNRYILVIYYPKLACTSCVNAAIVKVVAASESYHDVDYVLVSGESGYYLNNLKRVRHIKFPIFVEQKEGEAGMNASNLTLYLVDVQSQRAVLKYVPLPGEKDKRFDAFFQQVVTHSRD